MMRGDFSNWRDERRQNFSGVLHQQGRVLLDADWNAQTALTNDWQDTAGQDIIGANVAAVPAGQPNGFKITAAAHAPATDNVQLKVNPGRVWADGLLTQLYGEPDPGSNNPVARVATYLQPPVQSPPFAVASIAKDVRDAVILEVWREEINGFQLPDMLIEPALGGPDTTERIYTACAFRLMRLAAGDTCENITGRLRDDFSKKGKLKVSLQPTSVGGGDCPTVAGGGYTGFEHNLYRIEIADVDAGPPQFKWSQYGGGLVGRGHFDAAKTQVTITANQQAITNSGLSSFYLEAVEYDAARGHWRVTYGAQATLSNDILQLGAKNFGALPANPKATDTTFFRLWNDIALVQGFSNKELPNNVGIIVAFAPPLAGNYVPGDYWTFPVRAGEIVNADVLVNNEAPKGIHYHRVPLAVVTWVNNQDAHVPIEDCRHLFQPLTRLATCCSYRVGDGMHSWGDFDKIQDAINSLPASGGEICVLPGEYKENLIILEQRNITIKGCGPRSRIVAASDAPAVHINVSQNIKLESLAIIAQQKGIGVLLEGPDMLGLKEGGTTRDITLEHLYIEAATRCAIEAHIAFAVTIRGCDIEMNDEPSDAPGIFFTGDDSLIEDNIIRVLSAAAKKAGLVAGGRTLDTELFQHAQAGRGGLQIGGTSDRVRIVNNLIQGGQGNGITLGSVAETTDGQIFVIYYPGSKGFLDPCDPCKDLDGSLPPTKGGGGTTTVSAGALHEIYIERNLIYNMGSNGIGVALFFDLAQQDEFISVSRLTIVGNEIRRCMQRRIVDIPPNMLNSMGYGGIALADVDNLVVRDNVIEHNGLSHLFPICGIFVLHGEGLEVSRNRILNNGPKNGVSAQSARPGPRGGIYIVYGITPRVPIIPKQKLHVPAMNGVPAIKVHENIISAPLGQALALTALGPVSVVGNEFTSLGVIVRTDSLTFWATTVLIFNLGLSNELYFQLLAFNALAQGQIKSKKGYVIDGDTLVTPAPGLDDEVLGQYLANGNVLFSNNQCVLDLMDAIPEGAVSSILIASLDDVSFHGNQCDCDLFLGDLIFAQAILFGISLRVTDNRFKEGLFGAWLSAMTLGLLNMTTNNQSTHCLMIRGTKVEDFPNTTLLSLFNPDACDPYKKVKANLGKSKATVVGQGVAPVVGGKP